MNRSEVKSLAITEMTKWGLIARGWVFCLDERPKRRVGQCRYTKRQIGLTGWFIDLNHKSDVLDIIRHEISHALVGPDVESHGDEWKVMCVKVGCRPSRYVKLEDINRINLEYTATCVDCGKEHKLSHVTTRRLSCRCSRGRLDRPTLTWQRGKDTMARGKTAAAQSVKLSTDNDPRIEPLVKELRETTCSKSKKTIRAKLRRLGHLGGLR